MVAIKSVALLLALLATQASADVIWHKFTSNEMGWNACSQLLTATGTFCGKKVGTEECYCSNEAALGSISHCYVDNLNNSTTKINYFLKRICKKTANVTLTSDEFYRAYDNATDYLINPAKDESFNKTLVGYSPLIVTESKVQLYYTSNYRRYMNYNKAVWFGIAMLSYWALVMLVAGIAHWSQFIFPSIHKRMNGPISKAFKKYISLPAAGKKNHSVHNKFSVFEWLSPTRLESLIVGVWVVMVILMETIGFHHTPHSSVWPKSEEAEIGRLIADRAGISSLFVFPLIFLFGGRNNIMQWVTGWSYSRMMVFHRWTARVAVLLIFVHGCAMTASGIGLGSAKLHGREVQLYYQMGIIAVACGFILCFQGLLFFRKRWYEVFVLLHFALSAVFIAGGWIHTADDGYEAFWYPCVAVWALDRLIRILRLFWFGAPEATVELKADETLRITIQRPPHWKPFPGCHAFIHFLRPSCFWQSHPFTIVDSVVEENTITFYTKVKGGVTHGLYQYLATQPNNTAQIKVSVEGPYGNRSPIEKFDNAVFVAGGNGIPGLYAQAIDLANRKVDRQRVKLYWVIRHWKSIDWFYQELSKLQGTKVETVIYVTRPESGMGSIVDSSASASGSDDEIEKSAGGETSSSNNERSSGTDIDTSSNGEITDKDSKTADVNEKTKSVHDTLVERLKAKFPFIEFRETRPNIEEIVKDEIHTANGSIAFAACAHPNMVDEVRSQVVSHLETTEQSVEFYEQMQVW